MRNGIQRQYEVFNKVCGTKILKEWGGETSNTFYHGSRNKFSKFDISQAGTGEGVNKFGYGLYFTKNYDAANYYAGDGFYMYEVNIFRVNRFRNWDEDISDIQHTVIDTLEDMDRGNDAETIRNESGDNGYEYWTFRELYEYLSSSLDGADKASAFMVDLGIEGVYCDAVHANIKDRVYTVFDDSIIRIIDVTQL